MLAKLVEMVFSENVYAQADACFALGWAVEQVWRHSTLSTYAGTACERQNGFCRSIKDIVC